MGASGGVLFMVLGSQTDSLRKHVKNEEYSTIFRPACVAWYDARDKTLKTSGFGVVGWQIVRLQTGIRGMSPRFRRHSWTAPTRELEGKWKN
jgi:hypothetical protein